MTPKPLHLIFLAAGLALGACSTPNQQDALLKWYPDNEYYEGLDSRSLESESQQGMADAQLELAIRLMNGDRIERDESRAIELLTELSEGSRDPRALYFMGTAYAQGAGVDKNETKAVDLFRQGATSGYDLAQYWYGYMLSRGRGVPDVNWKEAIYWFRKAAVQGNADAQFILGEAIESCRGGLARDYNKAAYWYRRAEIGEQDQMLARWNLRRLIDLGLVEWREGDPGAPPETLVSLDEVELGSCEGSHQ